MIQRQIAKLINLKSLLTLIIVGVFGILACQNFFTNEQVYTLVYATIMGFLGYQQSKKV